MRVQNCSVARASARPGPLVFRVVCGVQRGGDGFEVGDELGEFTRLEGVVGRRGGVVGERLDPGLDGATVSGEPAIGAERRVLSTLADWVSRQLATPAARPRHAGLFLLHLR
jgi:hypothetical protein